VAPEKEKGLVLLRRHPAKKIPLPALIRHFGDEQLTAAGTACRAERVLDRDDGIWLESMPSKKRGHVRSHHFVLS
jgi:hypothetical protein